MIMATRPASTRLSKPFLHDKQPFILYLGHLFDL